MSVLHIRDASGKFVPIKTIQGPPGPPGEGSITGIALNGETYTPDSNGVIDLGKISGTGGAGAPDGGETGQTIAWDAVTGKPEAYPPEEHTHSYNDLDNKPTIPVVPNSLPNPYPLTINGQAYNGSEAVDVNIEAAGGGGAAYARNLLDNSDFTNPVNQRGSTVYESTSAAIYGIDRWKLHSVGLKAELIPSEGIKLTNTRTDARVPFTQLFEEAYVGRTLTVAVCDADTGNVYCANGTVPPKGDAIQMFAMADFNNHTLRLEMTKAGILTWTLMIAQGKTLKLRWAALYEGAYTADNLPPYMPKGYAAELKECLRYYQAFDNFTTFVGSNMNESNKWYPSIHTKETMRAAPKLIGIPTSGSIYGGGLIKESPTITAAAVYSYESGLLRLELTVAGLASRNVFEGDLKGFAVTAEL